MEGQSCHHSELHTIFRVLSLPILAPSFVSPTPLTYPMLKEMLFFSIQYNKCPTGGSISSQSDRVGCAHMASRPCFWQALPSLRAAPPPRRRIPQPQAPAAIKQLTLEGGDAGKPWSCLYFWFVPRWIRQEEMSLLLIALPLQNGCTSSRFMLRDGTSKRRLSGQGENKIIGGYMIYTTTVPPSGFKLHQPLRPTHFFFTPFYMITYSPYQRDSALKVTHED